MRLIRTLFIFSFVCCSAGLAQAAGSSGWALSVAPGYAIPMGDSSDYLKGAPSVTGMLMYSDDDRFSYGLEAGYIFGSKLKGTVPGRIVGDLDGDGVADPVSFDSDIHVGIFHLTPELKLTTTFEEAALKLWPYIIGGGGFYYSHTPDGRITTSGTTSGGVSLNAASGTLEGQNDKNGGFNVGGGLEVPVNASVLIALDVRYHQIVYKDGPDVQFIIPGLKLTWMF